MRSSRAELEEALAQVARLERGVAHERDAREQTERLLAITTSELQAANRSVQTLTTDLAEQARLHDEHVAEAHERALATSRAEHEFIAMMSHEIRTPLIEMLTSLDRLAVTDLDPDRRAIVDSIRAIGETGLLVVGDLVDFAKAETDTLELEIDEVDLVPELEQVACIHRPAAAVKGLALEVSADEATSSLVRGDRVRIRQIVSTLTSNAVAFTESGSVTIRCRTERDDEMVTVVIDVIDTGIGIRPDRIDRMFDLPTHVDALSRSKGGTGLVLALCDRLARMMGGSLQVRSQMGVGSTFTLRLFLEVADAEVGTSDRPDGGAMPTALLPPMPPAMLPPPVVASAVLAPAVPAPEVSTTSPSTLVEPGSAASTVEPAPAVDDRTLAALRVLVAEDDATNRKAIVALLGRLGLEADVVTNGAEAADAAAAGGYDVVLMDVQMPVLDGLEATRVIRALDDIGQPVIVALTASDLERDRQACFAAGMDDFMTKPYRLDGLRSALSRAAVTPAR